MLGTMDRQTEILDADQLCGHLVGDGSIHRKLAHLGDKLFSDEDFADLYDRRGRHSVPPSLLAKVMLLQSLEGTSDRETVDRVRCDLRWKVALHLPLDDEGFHPTVLTYFRERLRNSARPRRIFDRFKEVATEAGLLTARGVRVLDSTPVLSAVQTQDTVSLIKGALRRLIVLLARSDPEAKAAIQTVVVRDDYDSTGKPAIDWDDDDSRAALVDELVTDALSALEVLEARPLDDDVATAAELLATVAGQDVEQVEGRFRIRRGVAKDRVVSTVDSDARHGRKSQHGPFDGYKAHVAVDPDTELITEVEVTAANAADEEPLEDLLPELDDDHDADDPITIVADSAYGSGATRQALAQAGATVVIKPRPQNNSHGGFPKSAFDIDIEAQTATCPAGATTTKVVARSNGALWLQFAAETCAGCPLRDQCTSSPDGRSITIGPYEGLLAAARAQSRTDLFKAVYNGKRPTVERVIYRVVRNGGRKARYRGQIKVTEQLRLKAGAENLARMLRRGLVWTPGTGWAIP